MQAEWKLYWKDYRKSDHRKNKRGYKMRFFKKKQIKPIEVKKKFCEQCGEIIIKHSYPLFTSLQYCEKCNELCNLTRMTLNKNAFYIWNYGLKRHGLDWYIEARNNFCIEREKEKIRIDKDIEKELIKTKKEIDKSIRKNKNDFFI